MSYPGPCVGKICVKYVLCGLLKDIYWAQVLQRRGKAAPCMVEVLVARELAWGDVTGARTVQG
jgi:hypothetical protein